MFKIKYLNEDQLEGFQKYKYSSIDTSVLSVYVMHPFWNWCVQFFPRWMAPNVITFWGFLLTVLNFFVIAYYDYSFTAANNQEIEIIPRWVYLFSAINIFAAYTLDGIDGKQARRTGTSGPLGELFDHGLDSYSAVLIPIYMFSLFGTEDLPTYRMHLVIWLVFWNFYLSHFEKYNTGVMFLPWGYDFTLWSVTIVLFVTWITGPWIWRADVGIKVARIFEIVMYSSSTITNFPIVIRNIYLSYKNKTGKMRTMPEALRPLFPITALFTFTTMWIFLSHNKISDLEPRILFVTCGTIYSNICCRLIVAQMSDSRTEAWNFLLWPLLICTVLFSLPYKLFNIPNFSPEVEKIALYILAAISTIVHLHYGYRIIRTPSPQENTA